MAKLANTNTVHVSTMKNSDVAVIVLDETPYNDCVVQRWWDDLILIGIDNGWTGLFKSEIPADFNVQILPKGTLIKL